jgi:hypothetical protein
MHVAVHENEIRSVRAGMLSEMVTAHVSLRLLPRGLD